MRRFRNNRGVSCVEYACLLSVIAVACLPALNGLTAGVESALTLQRPHQTALFTPPDDGPRTENAGGGSLSSQAETEVQNENPETAPPPSNGMGQ